MKTKPQVFEKKERNYLKHKIIMILSLTLLVSASAIAQTITSVAELAVVATQSNQVITMAPGTYQMQDYLTPAVISSNIRDSNNRSAMINFSGANNTFDFTGVTIEVNTALLNDYGNRVIEFYVTGNNNIIKGLTVTDIGNSATSNGGQSFTISGDNVTVQDITLNVNGSSPYGYGDLLGKGGPNLVTMRKHSGMLIEGANDKIIRCSIYSQAFGHLFFIQGGRDVLFQDCHAEAVTRTTDAMLAETSGLAFDKGFEAVYSNYDGNKVITPGYTKSLSEVGYRSYGSGGLNGTTTGAITLINCTAKDTRSGFAFVRYGGDVLMQNCQATGCEAGFQVEEVTIENSRGDAVNGPLLYLNGGASTVELYLMPTVATTTLHAIATIGGNNHNVTIKNQDDVVRPQEHTILLGATRPSGANPFSPLGTTSTSGVVLNNCTEMPVELLSTVSSCAVNTNGAVIDNGGSGNIIDTSTCVSLTEGGFIDETYSIAAASPDSFYGWNPDFSTTYGSMSIDESNEQLVCTFEDNGSGFIRFYWRKENPNLHQLNSGNYPILAMKGKRPESYNNFTLNLNNPSGSVIQFKDGVASNGVETLTFSKLLPGTTDVYYWNLQDIISPAETWALNGFNCVDTGELSPISVMKLDYIKTFANISDLRAEEGLLSTGDLEQELDFSIYPNPTNAIVYLKSKPLNNATVSVSDLNGRILLNKNINGTFSEIDISRFSSGIYLFKVEVENNTFVKRIVKQ